jgi:predicted MFS family arabinose efflux permease
MIIYNLPALFGSPMGKLIDSMGRKLIPWCMAGMGGMLAVLVLMNDFWMQLLCMFVFSCLSMLLALSMSTEATKYTTGDNEHLGSFSGGWLDVSEVAGLIGPIPIGFLIDETGITYAFIGLALGALAVAAFLSHRWKV